MKRKFENGLKVIYSTVGRRDHENCDMGQLEYDCAECGKEIITTVGWYDYQEGEPFISDCCKGVYRYNKDIGDWILEKS